MWLAQRSQENDAIINQRNKDFPTLAVPTSDRRDYSLEVRLARAGQTLLGEGLTDPRKYKDRHDLIKARAVLLLTWLWTEKAADQFEIGKNFGPFERKSDAKGIETRQGVPGGRSTSAKMFLGYIRQSPGTDWYQWMRLVREALKVTNPVQPARPQEPDATNRDGEVSLTKETREITTSVQPTGSGEGKGTSLGPKKRASGKNRGRPSDTNKKEDARIMAAWETGHYRTYAELANTLKKSKLDIRYAIDRHRKRLSME